LMALDDVGEAQFARLTTSAGMSSGKGGLVASGGLDNTAFRVKPDEKSEVRLISGSLGGEAGIGAGGATLGYSANLDIMSVKKEGFQVRAGFDAGSSATVGFGGVEVKAAGFGLSVGKKTGISLPFGEVSVDLEETCVV
ncbi:12889_t:CDS:1, partial [Funneliformis geosporum]